MEQEGGLEAPVVSLGLRAGGSFELVCRYRLLRGVCCGMGLEDSVLVVCPLVYLVGGWVECYGSRGVTCRDVGVRVMYLGLRSNPIGVGIANRQGAVIPDICLDGGRVLIWVCVNMRTGLRR